MPRPDEGLIHAWLDGQLPPEEAARIEELAATDPDWAVAVAEARGLVAASSRILSALDRVPAGVVPQGTALRTMRLPWWTKIAGAVVVVVGGSVVVMQNMPDGRVPALSSEQGSAQPTPDTQKVVAEVPVTSLPVPAPPPPGTSARVPAAARTVGVPAGAVVGRADAPALREEAVSPQPITASTPSAPSARTIVAEEQKAVRDAERMVAGLAAPRSEVAKIAPSAAPSVAPSAAPSVAQGVAQSVAQSAAPQAKQASAQDLAQAQHAVPAQRVLGGVVALRSAQGQQTPLCYRVVPDSAGASAVVMRAVRTAGDTLYLASLESNPPRRAWLVLRDGLKGVMTTSGDLRSTVRIVATLTACPAP